MAVTYLVGVNQPGPQTVLRDTQRTRLDIVLTSSLRFASLRFASLPGAKKLFKKFDKSGDGLLDARELATMIRRDLKISKSDVSDADIKVGSTHS